MTPEAVVFRYLDVLRTNPVDRDLVARLLATDADLLGRWLRGLACKADPTELDASLQNLDDQQLATLAHAQAWQLLPSMGTARLAMDQWQSVCCAAFLAENLAAHIAGTGLAVCLCV